jgi:ADP-dependent NAD(P)H-hydrate dehydratase
MPADQDIPRYPERPAHGHKGTFGRVLVIAGSRSMSGAACLAGLGALRGGAGLVFVACPVGVQAIVAGAEPCYQTIGLPETEFGQLDASALPVALALLSGKDALAIGPGLGNTGSVREVVRALYTAATVPAVVDADGLNVLSDEFSSKPDSLANPAGPRILTPHPGELSRLCGLSIGEIQKRREDVARDFAARHGVVLVLKGPGTVVTDGNRVAINPTGNSGMATGGSGDVLTGLTGALLARGMEPFEAARLAVYLHGLAGDLAAGKLSEPGLIATDLPRFLGAAWQQLQISGEE